jgi:hypothetical protein
MTDFEQQTAALVKPPENTIIQGGFPNDTGYQATVTIGMLAHQRELTALSSCPTPSSSRLLLSVRVCTSSLFQPGSHRGFLMSPTSWTTA